MAEWQVGDVVQLKSGGPVMTVDSLCADGGCNCKWFLKGEQRGGYFPQGTLQKAPRGRSDKDKAV